MRALMLLADPEQPGLRENERMALRVRNAATVTGQCACGASIDYATLAPGAAHEVAMAHEQGCPAASPALERMAQRLGDRMSYRQYVVELGVGGEPEAAA